MKQQVTELGLVLELVESMEMQGRWPDLTRLRARRPDVLQAAVWMLGHDVPVRDICAALSVSPCTVQRIIEDPALGQSVVTQKRHVTANLRLAFRLGTEHLIEQARAGKLDAFALKLIHDMIQLADGGATSRTEHVVNVRMSEAAEAALKLLDSGMGSCGPKSAALSGGASMEKLQNGGLQALANAFSANELPVQEAVLLSNDHENPPEFPTGGGDLAEVAAS